MKRLDLNVFECKDPGAIYIPPRDHVAVSHDILGNIVISRSDGLKYTEMDLNRPIRTSSKKYSILSTAWKHIAISSDGKASTIVLYNKNGINAKIWHPMYFYVGDSLNGSISEYPLITSNVKYEQIYKQETYKAFMLTSVDKSVRLRITANNSYTLEKFRPSMSKQEVAKYYGIEETDIDDITQESALLYVYPNDFFHLEEGFFKMYVAPMAHSDSLIYTLIALPNNSEWCYLLNGVSWYYASTADFWDNTDFKYLAASPITRDMLVSLCGSLDYLMPLTYNKEENKLHLDYSVSATSETSQDTEPSKDTSVRTICGKYTDVQESREIQEDMEIQ